MSITTRDDDRRIGRTRHERSTKPQPLPSGTRLGAAQSCGDLIQVPSAAWHRHLRFAPPVQLTHWIEHFWLESWRVSANITETRELLPHPCVQLAFSPTHARVYGVQQGRFVRNYTGEGRVFGVKFRAGAFFPFFRKPVSLLSNSAIAASEVFSNATTIQARLAECAEEASMIEVVTRFLIAHLPAQDPNVMTIAAIVQAIIADRSVTRVHHLTARYKMNERSLQRLFQRYVGSSPRWVIKRYRAYEAMDHLNDPRLPQLAVVAQELGYFDQAHFANDFRNKVGLAPSEYTEGALRAKSKHSVSS
jgi:AraC-like DNA-binding protein